MRNRPLKRRSGTRTYRSLRCKQTRGMEGFCYGQCGPDAGLGFCGTDMRPPPRGHGGRRGKVKAGG